jgi:deazaflavin-dependent oxidoreductase (nitroreductase family)
LIRVKDGERYIVIASMGGAPQHPQWYLNLTANPNVVLHDRGQRHYLVARTASSDEKQALWPKAVEQWPAYDDYQAGTERDIPLVVLEPV